MCSSWLSNDWFLFLHLHGVLHHLRLFVTLLILKCPSFVVDFQNYSAYLPAVPSWNTLPLWHQLHTLLLLQLGLSLKEFIICSGMWLHQLYLRHCKDFGNRQGMRQRIPASPVLVFQWEWTNALTSAMLNAHFCWGPSNTVYPVKTSPTPSDWVWQPSSLPRLATMPTVLSENTDAQLLLCHPALT